MPFRRSRIEGLEMIVKNQNFIKATVTTALLLAFPGQVSAQSAPAPSAKIELQLPATTINAAIDVAMRQRGASEDARGAIAAEVLTAELMRQEALARGLEKTTAVTQALDQATRTILAQSYLNDELSKAPITDEQVKVEYNRINLERANAKQYQIRTASFESAAAAQKFMEAVRRGGDFDKLAREQSLDASKAQGGLLGWMLASDLVPIVSNVTVNLQPQSLAAEPIAIGNLWYALRLEGVRKFQPVPFDEQKAAIRQALVEQRVRQIQSALAEKYKINLK